MKPFAIALVTMTLGLFVTTSKPEAKPLTCEGRCERLYENCIKNARTERERAECPFERHECSQKCVAGERK